MTEQIKLYELCNDSDGGGTMEECEYGTYLLASDIDAEHLKTAINALTAVAIFDRFSDKPKEAIVHLSAILTAVRKQ